MILRSEVSPGLAFVAGDKAISTGPEGRAQGFSQLFLDEFFRDISCPQDGYLYPQVSAGCAPLVHSLIHSCA
jgi:hypothetical protein